MNIRKYTFLIIIAAIAATTAFAADDQVPADILSVEVVGVKDPDWRSYMTMLAGVETFEKMHELAPLANLRFSLHPQKSGVTLSGVALRIVNGATSYPLEVSADGVFALPRIEDLMKPNSILELNRKKDQVRWRPYIRTPGLTESTRRLGDLRLECSVRWAIEKSGFSFFKRNLVEALGGPCKTQKVATYYFADRVLASATISDGKKVAPLYIVRNSSVYLPPISDQEWGNDAIVQFLYQ